VVVRTTTGNLAHSRSIRKSQIESGSNMDDGVLRSWPWTPRDSALFFAAAFLSRAIDCALRRGLEA
jgi:hypothetical protein